ncbi:Methyltransferase domain-containing protein [Rubritalea squalenifaciens DSM 18772]|uniref:Methyltransferase domain-containing protein n=1 Tax=Rubritalea squalenifaciens DSM 18772 TaxID=1123071 RepID=A0A1M6DHB0_9BACT|nr:class I SAM-dependent methyltransferase [Rubritalea squalenifaciens]SHI72531.1 Methyltransferase domain-containing protein [Rubritalea squalenifaciens DSM 18772]
METKKVTCPISGKDMDFLFSETVLRKYEVDYFHCPESGLMRTEPPYWLDEAYSDAIVATDVGLVARNLRNSQQLAFILEILGWEAGKFVDVAGGYGLLTRMLRDKGFDCYSTDPYCENLFAQYFEPDEGFKADCIFAFEVMEHIENPLEFIEEAQERYQCRNFIFSTLLYGDSIPSRDWWYYVFDGGQHISFYQKKTLEMMADKLGCHYLSIDKGLHLFTESKLAGWQEFVLTNHFIRFFLRAFINRRRIKKSKTFEDFSLISQLGHSCLEAKSGNH